jgi:hypothetical protein
MPLATTFTVTIEESVPRNTMELNWNNAHCVHMKRTFSTTQSKQFFFNIINCKRNVCLSRELSLRAALAVGWCVIVKRCQSNGTPYITVPHRSINRYNTSHSLFARCSTYAVWAVTARNSMLILLAYFSYNRQQFLKGVSFAWPSICEHSHRWALVWRRCRTFFRWMSAGRRDGRLIYIGRFRISSEM